MHSPQFGSWPGVVVEVTCKNKCFNWYLDHFSVVVMHQGWWNRLPASSYSSNVQRSYRSRFSIFLRGVVHHRKRARSIWIGWFMWQFLTPLLLAHHNELLVMRERAWIQLWQEIQTHGQLVSPSHLLPFPPIINSMSLFTLPNPLCLSKTSPLFIFISSMEMAQWCCPQGTSASNLFNSSSCTPLWGLVQWV